MFDSLPKLQISLIFFSRVLLGFIIAIALALALPKLFGGQSYSVLSNSMAPAVQAGDMVAVLPVKPDQIRVGEIIAFNDPDGTGKLFQHRVQSLTTGSGNLVQVVTKGDANNTVERWTASANGQVGRVVFVVPKVGFVFGRIFSGSPVAIAGNQIPPGTLLLSGLMLIFGIIALVGIFREPAAQPSTLPDWREAGAPPRFDNFGGSK